MYLDVGEWVNASLLFSASFLLAGVAVFGLGWFVLRGDRINRTSRNEGAETQTEEQGHH